METALDFCEDLAARFKARADAEYDNRNWLACLLWERLAQQALDAKSRKGYN
jgi:hypothetical protein